MGESRRSFLKKSIGVAAGAGALSVIKAEKALARSERFRETLGVRKVSRPTYQKVGEVERFDSRNTAFRDRKSVV